MSEIFYNLFFLLIILVVEKNNQSISIMAAENNLKRRCNYLNCDSTGNMSGKYGNHYSLKNCPLYNNDQVCL
jgi:hypothetical protein